MQAYPLLHTKLYIPPLRPEGVSRLRLLARLDEGDKEPTHFCPTWSLPCPGAQNSEVIRG